MKSMEQVTRKLKSDDDEASDEVLGSEEVHEVVDRHSTMRLNIKVENN